MHWAWRGQQPPSTENGFPRESRYPGEVLSVSVVWRPRQPTVLLQSFSRACQSRLVWKKGQRSGSTAPDDTYQLQVILLFSSLLINWNHFPG